MVFLHVSVQDFEPIHNCYVITLLLLYLQACVSSTGVVGPSNSTRAERRTLLAVFPSSLLSRSFLKLRTHVCITIFAFRLQSVAYLLQWRRGGWPRACAWRETTYCPDFFPCEPFRGTIDCSKHSLPSPSDRSTYTRQLELSQ